MSNHSQQLADDRFNRARSSEIMSRIFSILKPEDHELLSLHDVRKALRSKGEDYQGYRAVPIDKIIGSEGRYRDFSRQYLPRREDSRPRWTRIDRAHQDDIILPAVNLYEIAGYYFVRDGNHRVSVARSIGMQEIDAIVIRLDTEIVFSKGEVTKTSLKRQVLAYEQEEFHRKTSFQQICPDLDIRFTEVGRYAELTHHFEGHHRYLQRADPTAGLKAAIHSWRQHIYLPIVAIIAKERILSRFPGRTIADLYIWIIKHRDILQAQQGRTLDLRDTARDLSKQYGKNRMQRALKVVRRFLAVFKR